MDYIQGIGTFTTCMGICGRIGCNLRMMILTSGVDTGYGFIANLITRELIAYIPSTICKERGCAGLCDILTTSSPAYAGSGNYPGTPPSPDYGVGPQ